MASARPDLRVLVHAPIGRDAAAIVDMLRRAGWEAEACGGLVELVREIRRGAGAVLIFCV